MNDSSSRIIKKYPNRRLYDTEESRYITLADIRRLVLEKTSFVVIDKKSQEDITRSILLQVIADQEGHHEECVQRSSEPFDAGKTGESVAEQQQQERHGDEEVARIHGHAVHGENQHKRSDAADGDVEYPPIGALLPEEPEAADQREAN